MKDRPIMKPTPMTIITMKGQSTGLMRSRMQRITTVVTLSRSPPGQERRTPPPQWFADQGHRSVRGRADTSALARAVRLAGCRQ